jgi:hypothetical protein
MTQCKVQTDDDVYFTKKIAGHQLLQAAAKRKAIDAATVSPRGPPPFFMQLHLAGDIPARLLQLQ